MSQDEIDSDKIEKISIRSEFWSILTAFRAPNHVIRRSGKELKAEQACSPGEGR